VCAGAGGGHSWDHRSRPDVISRGLCLPEGACGCFLFLNLDPIFVFIGYFGNSPWPFASSPHPSKPSPALPGWRTCRSQAPKVPTCPAQHRPFAPAGGVGTQSVLGGTSTRQVSDGRVAPFHCQTTACPFPPNPVCKYLTPVFIVKGPLPPVPEAPCPSFSLRPPQGYTPVPGARRGLPCSPQGSWMLV